MQRDSQAMGGLSPMRMRHQQIATGRDPFQVFEIADEDFLAR